MKLGKLGVWSFLDTKSTTEIIALTQRIEQWGYSALWIPEGVGRDAVANWD